MLLSDLQPQHVVEYFRSSASWGYYSDRRGVIPITYLEYARTDAEQFDDPRARINAVGNAKRAFHLQVEMLCDAFAWKAQGGRKGASFGTLLDYLGKCGALSPNILRKLNATRNKVEHEYITPSAEEVDDYLDIVELFLMATKSLLDQFPEYLEYELMKDDDYDPQLQLPETLTVDVKMIDGGIVLKSQNEERSIGLSSQEYFDWLSALVRHYML